MKEKIFFSNMTKKDSYDFLKENKERKILNFLNAHDIYIQNKENSFKKVLLDDNNINYIDGFLLSAKLSLTKLKRIPRNRGPTFTRDFLSNPAHSADSKHFFIGIDENNLNKLKKKHPHLKSISSYNPPYISNYHFPDEEINKIAGIINKEKPDIVWVGIGSPKQNILSNKLFYKTKARYFVNIGAALDFLIGKKREAPLFIRELGMEWFYRMIKDFRYSYKKVFRSFIALRYINIVALEKDD